MCISWLKKIFEKNEEIDIPVIVEPSGDTVVEESGNTEPVIVEPVIMEPEKKPYEGADFHILLDNGHASSTLGKRQLLEDGSYFFEYEFNRDIVRKIAYKLDKLGIPYEILVPEVDTDISLSTRAARANNCCSKYGTDKCFLISVHSNAFGDGKTFTDAKGWSVWTTKGLTKSDEYATILYNEAESILPGYGMTTRSQMTDGDPDYEENFTVIYKTWCPAVLTENMFFTNKKECEWLMTDEGREALARIHVEGIKKIIDSQ